MSFNYFMCSNISEDFLNKNFGDGLIIKKFEYIYDFDYKNKQKRQYLFNSMKYNSVIYSENIFSFETDNFIKQKKLASLDFYSFYFAENGKFFTLNNQVLAIRLISNNNFSVSESETIGIHGRIIGLKNWNAFVMGEFSSKLEFNDYKQKEFDEIYNKLNILHKHTELNKVLTSLENFNLSFTQESLNAKLIIIASALESLINNGVKNNLIGITLAKEIAKFISVDKSEFENIYDKILNFYKMRSDYIHKGIKPDLKFDLIFEIRNILRRVLKKILLDCCKKGCIYKHYTLQFLNKQLNNKGF